MTNREAVIADLLMGAAHADGHLDGRELQRVRELLRRASQAIFLSDDLRNRMRGFQPDDLDIDASVATLGLSTPEEKRQLLEFISSVHEADNTWDLSEDEYLQRVAKALGMDLGAYADLTLGEIQIESIGRALLPPPLPKKTS